MSAMDVSITDLPAQEGATKDLVVEVTAPSGLGTDVIGVPSGADLRLSVSLVSVADGVLVRGHGRLPLHGQCVRCLRDLDEERMVSFDELYLSPEAVSRQRQDGDEEVEEMFVLGTDTLDLEPALRDALVLDLPFQPLCRPDCPGLCPTCGQRLEDLPADHHHEVVDPRWSALAGLSSLGGGQEAGAGQRQTGAQ